MKRLGLWCLVLLVCMSFSSCQSLIAGITAAPDADCETCGDTEEIQCTVCGGDKETQCALCFGTGRNTCLSCGGTGFRTCFSCGGLGMKYGYDFLSGGYKYTSCFSCTGGRVSCIPYYICGCVTGTKACVACNENGKMPCPDCSGS